MKTNPSVLPFDTQRQTKVWGRVPVLLLLLGLFISSLPSIFAQATNYSILHQFGAVANDGTSPQAGLILANGRLYGTTSSGGASGAGAVFGLNTDGTVYANVHHFAPGGSFSPQAPLLAVGDTLYGTGGGLLFKLNSNGSGFTNIHTLSDGVPATGSLLLSGSTLYGITSGDIGGPFGGGVFGEVFKVNTNGTGYANLLQSPGDLFGHVSDIFDGTLALSGSSLYGKTEYGSVFQVSTNGLGFTDLLSFGLDVAFPHVDAGLVLSGSTLYGTSLYGTGSAAGSNTVFKLDTTGSGFTTLHVFSPSEGATPRHDLLLSGNTLYGVMYSGGAAAMGTIYSLNTDGTGFTVLYNFGGSDGANPCGNLVLSGSTLYGTTSAGGSSGQGVVFALSLSPAPIPLNIQALGSAVVLSWTNSAFALQAAPAVSGSFTNVPGAISPWTNAVAKDQQFYRLKAN